MHYYHDCIRDPQLKAQVGGFIGQEAMHGREHNRYNRILDVQGYDVKPLERSLREDLAFAQENLSPRHQLSITYALEHFTAIMADAALRDDSLFDRADPRYAALWRWHAVEETEHKAMAFDVYRCVAPGWRDFMRRMISKYLAYYRPDFHPWQHDNRQLVEGWKAAFEQEDTAAYQPWAGA